MSKPQPKSDKLLISVPFYVGDKAQAGLMVKLLADLEASHSEQADILLTSRFDCTSFEPAAIKYISRKFNVYQHRSQRRETGWPSGCNGCWMGSLEYIYHKMDAGQLPNYKAIFNMASDVVPLRRDWLSYLHDVWNGFKKAGHPICVAGAFLEGPRDHINGDACFLSGDLKFLKWLAKDVGGIKVKAGWDWVLAPTFQEKGWSNVAGIKSLWNTPTMPRAVADEWRKNGAVLIHGVKDSSLLDYARSVLL